MTPPPIIKHTTTCRECGQEFKASPLGIAVIGETAPARVVKFVMALAEHFATQHRDKMQALSNSIQDFTGLLILNEFDTDDPGLRQRTDQVRGDIHKRTRQYFVTDAAILDLVSRVGLDPEHEKTVAALMRGMRDAYEETGAFTPGKQQSSPLITA
jgi:hypothetical protein